MNYIYTLEEYKTWAEATAGRQGYWYAVCNCHSNTAKISLENLVKLAHIMQVNPSTKKGITALNHEILRRVK